MKKIETKEFDFVIVGGGTMGVSTALYLSLQYPQAKTVLIQQYFIGNEQGASHSQTRVIRSTYDHQFYRDLSIQCRNDYWPYVESLLGEKLVFSNPYVSFVEEQTKVYKNYKRTASTSKTIKQISTQEAQNKFPYIPKLTTCKNAFFEQGAGLIMSAKYISGVKKYLIQRTNVQIYQNTSVLSCVNDQKGAQLQVKTPNSQYIFNGKRVALCCGRWINHLVPSVSCLLKHVKQVVTYWKMKNSQNYKIGEFPIFVHLQANGDYNYVLPDGASGDVKYMMFISDSSYWDKSFTTDQEFRKAVIGYMRKKMEYHYGEQAIDISKIETCWYSFSKKDDFIIDWSDKNRNVLIVSPCSGHGFKFSPIIGKIVTDLLQKDKTISVFQKYRQITSLKYQLDLLKQE